MPQNAAAEDETTEHFAFGVEYDWSNMDTDFESMTGLPLDEILGDVMQSADDAGIEMLILEEITGTSSVIIDQYDDGTMMFNPADGSGSVEVTKHVTELTLRHGGLMDMALITEWSDAYAGWDLTISGGNEGIFNADAYYVEYRDASGLIYGHDLEMSMNTEQLIFFDLEGSLEADDGDSVMPLDIHMEVAVDYAVTNAESSVIYTEASVLHQKLTNLEGGDSLEWRIGDDDDHDVYWDELESCEWDYDWEEYRCDVDWDDDGYTDWEESYPYCEYYSSFDVYYCTYDFGHDEDWVNAVDEGWTHYYDETSPEGDKVVDEVESHEGTFSTATGFNFELTGLPAEELGFAEGKWDVSASDDVTDSGSFDEEYECDMGMKLFEGTQMITTDGDQIEVMQAHTSPLPFGMTCHIGNLFVHTFVGSEDAPSLEDMIADSTEDIAESLGGDSESHADGEMMSIEVRAHNKDDIEVYAQAWNLDPDNRYEIIVAMEDSDGGFQSSDDMTIYNTHDDYGWLDLSTTEWGENCVEAKLKNVDTGMFEDEVQTCVEVSQDPEPSQLLEDIIEGFSDSTLENVMENFGSNLEYRLENYEADFPYDDGDMFVLWDDNTNMVVGFQMVVTSDDSNMWYTLIGPESNSYGTAPSPLSFTYFSGQQAIAQEADIEDDSTLEDLVDLTAHNNQIIEDAIEDSLADNNAESGGEDTDDDSEDGLLPFMSPVLTLSMIAIAGLVASLRSRKE
jgi:hypothetical protein